MIIRKGSWPWLSVAPAILRPLSGPAALERNVPLESCAGLRFILVKEVILQTQARHIEGQFIVVPTEEPVGGKCEFLALVLEAQIVTIWFFEVGVAQGKL